MDLALGHTRQPNASEYLKTTSLPTDGSFDFQSTAGRIDRPRRNLMPRRFVLLVPLLVFALRARAEPPTAAKPLDANSSVNDVLDALHARGQNLKDFTADVSLTITDALG